MQFLGPTLNGWTTSRLSLKKGDVLSSLAAGSQRSGRNERGWWKFDFDQYAAD
jgi:hypothetical protein